LFISFIQRNPRDHLPHHQSHQSQLCETEISVSSLFYYHLFAITFKNLFSAGTRVSRQSNPTVSVTMEAETQTEEEQVNIIELSDPITPMNIGKFAPIEILLFG
jgi:hypothetical protein